MGEEVKEEFNSSMQAKITINDVLLNATQSRAFRMAIEVFDIALNEPYDDKPSKDMVGIYRDPINEIQSMIFDSWIDDARQMVKRRLGGC